MARLRLCCARTARAEHFSLGNQPRFRHTPENESAALLLESGRLHPTNSSQFSVDLEARTWAVRLLCSRCVRATATATPMIGHSASAFAGLRKTATKVACFAESAAVVFPSDAAAAGCAKAARKTNAKPRKRLEKTRWTRANRGDGFVRERDPDRLRLASFMKTIILINDSHCLENSCARKILLWPRVCREEGDRRRFPEGRRRPVRTKMRVVCSRTTF